MQKKIYPFWPITRVARNSGKFSKKKSVSQSTRNALKRIEMKKKIFTPLRTSRVAQSASGEAQPYLPHVTPRVHDKFHADWTHRAILII